MDAVVFDEVHYINNRERGRVWEETLILLPPTVNLVLLSATIDGPELFAGWLGNLKEKPIHLISTQYRIVPLTHALIRGTTMHTLMDHKEKFNAQVYTDWLRSLKEEVDNYKAHQKQVSVRRQGNYETPVVEGTKRPASYIQQLNECIHMLDEKQLLPALFFNFSRKGCENFANRVQGSLLTSSETASVKHIIDFHLHKYPAVYNSTKQFFTISELLQRGIAFHHSGLLPLLKEIIEILFSKGFVKVLFATETFAVGINMPTKTVVFTGYEKYDDATNGIRTLFTDEYIQMAGRAGRRGKDTEGLVLYLPERDPISLQEVQRMFTGNKSTFISRMEFHYDFILKTLQSGNTTWMSLMSQSYWYQQHLRLVEGVRRELNEVKEKLAALGLTEEMIQDMELRERLEYELKTSINAAKKKAQQSLEQWKNKHMSPIYAVQWTKYTERKKFVVDLERLEDQLTQMEQYRETLYPILRVLEQTGFLEPITDPLNTQLTLLGTLATELNEGNPLLMSYAYTKGLCDVLSGEEIICFLCAFLNERTEMTVPISSLKIPKSVIDQLYSLDLLLDTFFEAEKKHGVQSPITFWHLNSYWIEPVWRWIQGDAISTICEEYDVYEGNFMRTILKVSNLLEEFKSLATYTQNVEMLAKLENVQKVLVKDAAIPESLYLTI